MTLLATMVLKVPPRISLDLQAALMDVLELNPNVDSPTMRSLLRLKLEPPGQYAFRLLVQKTMMTLVWEVQYRGQSARARWILNRGWMAPPGDPGAP